MEMYTREQVEIALKVEFNRGFQKGYEKALMSIDKKVDQLVKNKKEKP